MVSVKLENLEENVRFQVRLEIALRNSAIRIRDIDGSPRRFDQYISDREDRIRKLLRLDGDLMVTESGKTIFP